MSVFLGIDIGTSGTKTLAIDAEGRILASALETYPLYHPKPLWSEQDPDDWWQATIGSVRRVVKTAKLKPADVKAIGLSGQMHGSVFLDKQCKVVRRAILWNDQRTAAECEEIEQPRRRPRELDPHGRQPGPDRLHRPQDPLAAEPRAEEFREDQEGPAAQGRNPPPPDRRVCHRSQRRQRHAAAWTWPSGPGRPICSPSWNSMSSLLGPLLRIGGSDRPAHARRGGRVGPVDRLPGRGRGRRLRGRRRGQRHRQPRACSPPRSAPPA